MLPGAPMSSPDWLSALASACAASTQTAVAKQLLVSPSTVNQVLRGKYRGDLGRVEARVRGALMQETVTCPVLGDLATDQCQEQQGMGFYPSSIRAALYRNCRICTNATKAKEIKPQATQPQPNQPQPSHPEEPE